MDVFLRLFGVPKRSNSFTGTKNICDNIDYIRIREILTSFTKRMNELQEKSDKCKEDAQKNWRQKQYALAKNYYKHFAFFQNKLLALQQKIINIEMQLEILDSQDLNRRSYEALKASNTLLMEQLKNIDYDKIDDTYSELEDNIVKANTVTDIMSKPLDTNDVPVDEKEMADFFASLQDNKRTTDKEESADIYIPEVKSSKMRVALESEF